MSDERWTLEEIDAAIERIAGDPIRGEHLALLLTARDGLTRAQPSESDRERALDQIASSYDSGCVDDIGADAWAGWAADTARAALRSAVCEKSDMERVDDWLHRRTRPGTPDLRMVWDREEKRSLAAEFAAVRAGCPEDWRNAYEVQQRDLDALIEACKPYDTDDLFGGDEGFFGGLPLILKRLSKLSQPEGGSDG